MVAARHLRAPHEEHLRHRVVPVLGQTEDIDIGLCGRRGELRLRHPADGRELVAQLGCPLIFQARCRSAHLLLQRPFDGRRAPFEEEDHLVDDRSVLFRRAVRGARCDAALDVIVQAGPRVGSGDGLRAGAPGEQLLHQGQRRPHRPGAGVGPKVARAVALDAPRDVHPWPGLVHVDLEIGIVFIVLETHVVKGLVPLDQRRLQVQRLLLRAGGDVLEVGDAPDEVPRLALQGARRAEVRAHPRPQARRLADVEDLPARVAEDVDARSVGQGPPTRR